MNKIRPVSDLYSCFDDISRMVHETQDPVFLTKDGYGDMVVMSMEAYENLKFEGEVYFKLKEAEEQAAKSNRCFSTQEVFQQLMETIQV
ncbi:MAG: type II toxin-antitoxin system Phd/YefM family antitoxin [Treponema sp.]|nr:type II toxin-antitoxin system Phd/YefM family antitoxin [Treponema sp.]